MNRRELIKRIAMLTGAAFVGGDILFSGCNRINGPLFSDSDIAFFDEVAETIIPRTTTPGAKDAAVGRFIALYASDCYDDVQQGVLKQGIREIDDVSKSIFKTVFLKLSAEQKHFLLMSIDKEVKSMKDAKEKKTHYYILMKQLTLLGFFTSEPGAKHVLRSLPVPGGYQGCIDYNGETAWS